jgi:hypothetical protein
MLATFAALLAVATGADHLVPLQANGSTYDLALQRWLVPDASPDVVMLCAPSFQREVAVYVVRSDSSDSGKPGAMVVVNSPKQSIWDAFGLAFARRGTDPATRHKLMIDEFEALARLRVEVETKRAPIDVATLAELERVWDTALEDARQPNLHPTSIGLDGETCTYADFVPLIGNFAGTSWSPESESKMGALHELGVRLTEYARAAAENRDVAKTALLDALRIADDRFGIIRQPIHDDSTLRRDTSSGR